MSRQLGVRMDIDATRYRFIVYQYLTSNDNNLQLDDALSATKLQDGRIKVWIHVADPASFVEPGSLIDRYI